MQLKALHSPSCIYYGNELFIAFYAGERECVNQRVLIFKKEKKNFVLFKQLPIGSGNPVLMTFNNKLYCCYSMFTREMKKNVFDLWKTTFTNIQDLSSDDKYTLSTYCCPRVNPYYFPDGSLILPCYDEGIERGMIFHLDHGKVIDRYVCMSEYPVIQPTLILKNSKLFAIFRNFKKGMMYNIKEFYAPYVEIIPSVAKKSLLFGDLKMSKIPNHNESIASINDKEKNPLIVYNAKRGRSELTLGIINQEEDGTIYPDPILQLNETPKASYPNCCFNKKNQLVVSYTAYENGINSGSSICVTTISSKYNKILSRKYITPEMTNTIN